MNFVTVINSYVLYFSPLCRIRKRDTGGCNLGMTMCWGIGLPSSSHIWLTVLPWSSGEVKLWILSLMVSTPQLKWEVVIFLKRGLASQVTSEIFKWLTAPTISKLPKALAPSLSNQIVMMSKQAVMGIGVITFTMVALEKILIVNESNHVMKQKKKWKKIAPSCTIQS